MLYQKFLWFHWQTHHLKSKVVFAHALKLYDKPVESRSIRINLTDSIIKFTAFPYFHNILWHNTKLKIASELDKPIAVSFYGMSNINAIILSSHKQKRDECSDKSMNCGQVRSSPIVQYKTIQKFSPSLFPTCYCTWCICHNWV